MTNDWRGEDKIRNVKRSHDGQGFNFRGMKLDKRNRRATSGVGSRKGGKQGEATVSSSSGKGASASGERGGNDRPG